MPRNYRTPRWKVYHGALRDENTNARVPRQNGNSTLLNSSIVLYTRLSRAHNLFDAPAIMRHEAADSTRARRSNWFFRARIENLDSATHTYTIGFLLVRSLHSWERETYLVRVIFSFSFRVAKKTADVQILSRERQRQHKVRRCLKRSVRYTSKILSISLCLSHSLVDWIEPAQIYCSERTMKVIARKFERDWFLYFCRSTSVRLLLFVILPYMIAREKITIYFVSFPAAQKRYVTQNLILRRNWF